MTREEIVDGLEFYTAGRPLKSQVSITVQELQSFIDAIKALEQEPCEDAVSRESIKKVAFDITTECDTESIHIDRLIYEIENLPSVTTTQRWISASERLPEPNKLVICYITTGVTETYFLALWNDVQNAWEEGVGGYRLIEYDLGYEVVAWMPLPEPYKAESEE